MGFRPGANNYFWLRQPRDGKGRWVEMFGIGKYSKDGLNIVGQVIGSDEAGNVSMERRTVNGQPSDKSVDVINPNTLEMMDVKATLDNAPGFSDEDMAKARNSENTRPKPASYPNGTTVSTSDSDLTKNGENSWSDSEGNTLTNDEVAARLDEAPESTAQIPEEADLTSENILNATDGSVLSWNSKSYSRIDGKWYDDKTGKPVSDRTMGSKTDGDLSTEGAESQAPSPTPASEYPTNTKLHAEMQDGQSTADLTKTDENAWDVTTDSSETQADDPTVDSLIQAADTVEDVTESAQPETESDSAMTPAQAIDTYGRYMDETALDVDIDHATDPDFGEETNQRAREELARAQADVETALADPNATEDEKFQLGEINSNLKSALSAIDSSSDSETDTPTPEPEVEEVSEPEVSSEYDKPISEIKNANDFEWEVEDPSLQADEIAAMETATYRPEDLAGTDGITIDVTRDRGSRSWRATIVTPEGDQVDVGEAASKQAAKNKAVRALKEDYDNIVGSEENDVQEEVVPTPEPETPTRTTDDILSDLDDDASYATEQLTKAAEGDSSADITGAQERIRNRAQELLDQRNASPQDRRKIDSSIDDLRRMQAALDQADTPGNDESDSESSETTSEWEPQDVSDLEGISEEEVRYVPAEDGEDHQITVQRSEDDGKYYAAVFPSGSEEDIAGEDGFDSKEEARDYGQKVLDDYLASESESESESESTPDEAAENTYDDELSAEVEADRDAIGSYAEFDNDYEEDPEEITDLPEEPTAEDVLDTIREEMESGEHDFLDIDESNLPSTDQPSEDSIARVETNRTLDNPQEGDELVTASGRAMTKVGMHWTDIRKSGEVRVSDEALRVVNESGPNPVYRVGSTSAPAPAPSDAPKKPYGGNKYNVATQGGDSAAPDFMQITNPDGTTETYAKYQRQYHRVLNKNGALAKAPTSSRTLNQKIDNSAGVATKNRGETAPRTQRASDEEPVQSSNLSTVLTDPDTPKVTTKEQSKPSEVVNRITTGDPNTVLTDAAGKRVGATDSEGNAYYFGDRVIVRDRSKQLRSGTVAKISVSKNGTVNILFAPDENDSVSPDTARDSVPFEQWKAMSVKERKANGLGNNYPGLFQIKQQELTGKGIRRATAEDTSENLQREIEQTRANRAKSGEVVTSPTIIEDRSIDRVYRDASTRIIGTLNKHGELFQPGEVVEYGPNGEVGTIQHIGEADDKISIIPNGQSGLEAVRFHVDTIKHTDKEAKYFDANYDVPARERVINDRNNKQVRVGDIVNRYGMNFEVTDIYADGRTVRVVGADTEGIEGASASPPFETLMDLGFSYDEALDISSGKSHDFIPEHIQLFQGDPDELQTHRTHNTHTQALMRDDAGNVRDTEDNRTAALNRARGNRQGAKDRNSAMARYIAENGGEGKYEEADLQPGDMIDTGIDQNIDQNTTEYVNTTFGSDMVIPENSRLIGYNEHGDLESYIKKDGLWYINSTDTYGMNAQEFFQYRLDRGYRPVGPDVSDHRQSRRRLTYVGDADDAFVPRHGAKIAPKDREEKFALMPTGSIVRFEDADGNMITIKKMPNGEWVRVGRTGNPVGGSVDIKSLTGTSTFRGVSTNEMPKPSVEADDEPRSARTKNGDQRRIYRDDQELKRDAKRIPRGESKVYTYTSGAGTFREKNYERQVEEAQAQAAAAQAQLEAMRKLLEQAGVEVPEDLGSITASATRVTATNNTTKKVVAVYNRVNDNIWEYTTASGNTRTFTMDSLPSTPGITYTVEENVA